MDGLSREGLLVIDGGTGNGKSTLMAEMIRKMPEQPNSHRAILEHSAPVEFICDENYGEGRWTDCRT
jgi:defect in organelle trafficking protein DotB